MADDPTGSNRVRGLSGTAVSFSEVDRLIDYRRILSSAVGSAPLGKSSTLLYFSTAYKHADPYRYDPICLVLNMELLQFYYSPVGKRRPRNTLIRQTRFEYHASFYSLYQKAPLRWVKAETEKTAGACDPQNRGDSQVYPRINDRTQEMHATPYHFRNLAATWQQP
jgi:hypothetical protein